MAALTFYLVFRGIEVPTISIMGREACAFTVKRIEGGIEVPSEAVYFAYEEGIAWKGRPIEVEPGKYRIECITPSGKLRNEITITNEAVDSGDISIAFRGEHFTQSRIPILLKRTWWKFRDLVHWCSQLPLFDVLALWRFRRRFRRGPIGTWLSSHEMLTVYGCEIQFRHDGTGSVRSWGVGEDESTEDDSFRWTSVGDYSIDIQLVERLDDADVDGRITFDFHVRRSTYGNREIVMVSQGQMSHEYSDDIFWRSPHPVVLVREKEEPSAS